MDHPHIARVLDGGLTPSGQPFFVMELVTGLPLTKFCDEARLDTPESGWSCSRAHLPSGPTRSSKEYRPPRPQTGQYPGHVARQKLIPAGD